MKMAGEPCGVSTKKSIAPKVEAKAYSDAYRTLKDYVFER